MAKTKKLKIGSIQKKKDGTKTFVATPFDLKNMKQLLENSEIRAIMASTDPKTKKYFNVESKQEQITNLNAAVASGRLSEEIGDKILTNLNKIPDFVLADISVIISDENSF